jgi:hypothetical protein
MRYVSDPVGMCRVLQVKLHDDVDHPLGRPNAGKYVRVYKQYDMDRPIPNAFCEVTHRRMPFCSLHAGMRITEAMLRPLQVRYCEQVWTVMHIKHKCVGVTQLPVHLSPSLSSLSLSVSLSLSPRVSLFLYLSLPPPLPPLCLAGLVPPWQ